MQDAPDSSNEKARELARKLYEPCSTKGCGPIWIPKYAKVEYVIADKGAWVDAHVWIPVEYASKGVGKVMYISIVIEDKDE